MGRRGRGEPRWPSTAALGRVGDGEERREGKGEVESLRDRRLKGMGKDTRQQGKAEEVQRRQEGEVHGPAWKEGRKGSMQGREDRRGRGLRDRIHC